MVLKIPRLDENVIDPLFDDDDNIEIEPDDDVENEMLIKPKGACKKRIRILDDDSDKSDDDEIPDFDNDDEIPSFSSDDNLSDHEEDQPKTKKRERILDDDDSDESDKEADAPNEQ